MIKTSRFSSSKNKKNTEFFTLNPTNEPITLPKTFNAQNIIFILKNESTENLAGPKLYII